VPQSKLLTSYVRSGNNEMKPPHIQIRSPHPDFYVKYAKSQDKISELLVSAKS